MRNSALYLLLGLSSVIHTADAEEIKVQSYGHYKKMIHMEDTAGVVGLKQAIAAENSYAVGAIQDGKGEITILNGKVYLDYGKDGIGGSLNKIPLDEKAVLLATAKVDKWKSVKISTPLPKEQLFEVILAKAKEHGLKSPIGDQ